MPTQAQEAPQPDAPRTPEYSGPAPGRQSRRRPRPENADEANPAAPVPLPPVDESGALIEAALLSADRPVSAPKLAEALGLASPAGTAHVREAIDRLNQQYESAGRSFRIEQVAGGFRIMTLPAFGAAAQALRESRASTRLSRAGVETLAVIAYRQPITRAEIEAIRGVACGEVLGSLLERRLIAVVGRAEEVGRPMLYGTSRAFLETFGLASIKDLPTIGDLAAFQKFEDAPPERAEPRAGAPAPESEATDAHA